MTNAEKCRAYRDRLKCALIQLLGGKCKICGATERLEFDHPHGRTWVAREVWA
jgi:hypothetical protein